MSNHALRPQSVRRILYLAAALFSTSLPVAQVPSAPPGASPPGNILPSFPLPSGPRRPTDARQTPDPNATPVPPSGNHEGFSYAPSGEYEGVSVVYPTDGSGPYLVSDRFLQSSLGSATSDDVRLKDFQMYEQMTNMVGEQFANQMYPDASAGDANVQRQVIEGAERNVVVEQDSNAGPYARVTVTDKEGNILSEHSVSAKNAAMILGNPSNDAEKKIDALQNTKFALPEELRANFNSLSKQELLGALAERPEFQNQDFLKMTSVFATEKAKQTAGNSSTTSPSESARRESANSALASANENRRSDQVASAEQNRANDVKPPARDAATDAPNIDQPAAAGQEGGWHLPTIAGILLGVAAIGVFLFGLFKTRR